MCVCARFFAKTMLLMQATRTVDPKGRQWNRLKTAIKQPDFVPNGPESEPQPEPEHHPEANPQPALA